VTKDQVAWLLIRLAGLWLLWQAAEGTVTLISSYLFVIQNNYGAETTQFLTRSAGVFWQFGLGIALHLALGVFCLSKGGNVLFYILTGENGDSGGGHGSILK